MTQTPDDLLLRIRLESLNHSFQRMEQLAASMTSPNVGVERLRDLLSGEDMLDDESAIPPAEEVIGLNMQLRSVEDLLHSLITLLNLNQDLTPKHFRQYRLEKTAVTDASKRLSDLERTLTAVKDEVDTLWDELSEWDYLGQRGLEHASHNDFREVAKKVDLLLRGLRDGNHQEGTWGEYQDLIATRTPPLFKGFVEIASGLTLRGRRLDDRVCAMADDLVADWSTYSDLSAPLTLPALNDEDRASDDDVQTARMVRLGFAGWTVWSLPLFAGTFWRIHADEFYAQELSQIAAGEDELERLRVYLGDSLAVEMMGPAYVCSLILLRLDPAQTDGEGAKAGYDHVRAKIALGTIRPAPEREMSELQEIVDLLDRAWTNGLARPGCGERTTDLQFVDPVLDIAKRFVKEIEGRPGRLRRVDESRWKQTDRLAGHALGGIGPGQSRKDYRNELAATLADFSVVDVLNAVWRRRLLPESCDPPAAKPHDQSAEASRIASLVSEHIWPCLQRPAHGAGPTRLQGGTRRGR